MYLTVCMWLERLTANAPVATVLGSILASVDTVESEGRQMILILMSRIDKYRISIIDLKYEMATIGKNRLIEWHWLHLKDNKKKLLKL